MRSLSILFSFALCAFAIIAARELPQPQTALHNKRPKPPSWPESYSLTYEFTLPYTSKIQPDAIKYTVTLHRDASIPDRRQVRLETLNGTNTMIAIAGDAEYEIQPELDERVCNIYPGGHGAASANALPDISDWTFGGEEELNGQMTSIWQYQRRNEGKVTIYKFYVSLDGNNQPQPVRLYMIGQEISMGSHFGEYLIDYLDLVPGTPDPELFDPPTLCDKYEGKNVLLQNQEQQGMSPAGVRMMSLLPSIHYRGEDEEYDVFLTTGHGRGRTHASLQEYRHRLSLFQKNSAIITAHNAANKSFTMAMNRFGDWTREEFLAVMLPLKYKKLYQGYSKSEQALNKEDLQKHEYPYEPLTDISKIPATVDWRGSGADSGIKDQALCGSCWAFGAVGAMESAWFHATGQSARFSEQAVMDCSYQKGRAAWGCDGGGAWAGIGHIVESGGISLLKDYQYLGLTDYCREDSRPRTGKFKGFARIPSGDDTALMEALYSRGPVAVSLDASSDAFTFYSGGVYYDAQCKYEYDDLDHAMVAVGYGTEESGDYFLIKNSWSDHWGDEGYIKVSRDNHGCGASTDALYAIVDDDQKRN
jgi:Papain family cysteine protease/Cathepsin propeptide inhibitor domain (I29)